MNLATADGGSGGVFDPYSREPTGPKIAAQVSPIDPYGSDDSDWDRADSASSLARREGLEPPTLRFEA